MPTPLLLDACIAINLIATNRADKIAKVVGVRFTMVRQAAEECVQLRVDERQIPVAMAGGDPFAEVLTLAETEIPPYVRLAGDIDDGEAATIALANSRSLTMATDDRKARRVAVEEGLDLPIGTTDILRKYATVATLTPQEVTSMLKRVQNEASYIPRRSDVNFAWWEQSISS
ncbi:hypothetical protein [Amycolatopsis sp. NPDC004625]|uniref:hypothetical protein n=1 Tax=Amycolatopsis sp. NPDC004625 TaxID=3154670 RepID=UPI0033AB74B4